jgi:uncharacterized membrane protein YoaK (UPF0700 family)
MLNNGRNILLASVLSTVTGYVDGIGFLHLSGLFVSFMSGNSTRMGVSLAQGRWWEAAGAAGLIGLFVAGATCGSLIVLARTVYAQACLLLTEAALLAVAGLCHIYGMPFSAIAAIVLAMGLENAVFQVEGGAGLGLTYVTGALVKVGQQFATALTGGSRLGWVPDLLLWASLVGGSIVGAFAYLRVNLGAIWFAAAVAFVLSTVLAAVAWRHQRGKH